MAAPSAMIAEFAPAKINLALHVLGRRADGYHELDSIVAFADVGDRLTFEPARETTVTATGPFAAELPPLAENIIYRAWSAARTVDGDLPPVRVALEKNLPVSSGIGGGSADAAATLRALAQLSRNPGLAPRLPEIALALGADVPVCLHGRPSRMRGIGEQVRALADFAPLAAVLVNPGVRVPTAAVFAAMGLAIGQNHRAPIAGAASWRNDMTEAAITLAPVIAEVLHTLQALPGASATRMSGSGATCFAIFDSPAAASLAARFLATSHPAWWVATTLIVGQQPVPARSLPPQ